MLTALRIPLLSVLALLAIAPGLAQAQQAAEPPTAKTLSESGHGGRLLLDGRWLFRLDQEDQGLAQRFQDQEATEGWGQVRVPNAFNAGDDSPESQRGTVAWYRRDFVVPKDVRATAWRVRFESANYRATVFLNGKELGSHEGASIPFEVAASRLRRRGVNRLVVRIDSRRSDTDLPPLRDNDLTGLPGGGWWNYGGLLREVYLRPVNRVDIAELLARPELPCRTCDATVLLRMTLQNPGGGRQKVRPTASVGGREARFRVVSVPSGATRVVFARVKIEDPRLWEIGRPSLYTVRAAVTKGGRQLGTYSTRIGIRSIEVDERGRFLLNGRSVKTRGASIHEDHPRLGAALGPGEREAIFGQLLALGATITRAHYPLHPHFLEMADRAGVLVWEQIPFYRVKEDRMRLRALRDKGLRYLEATIARDQNHPSVISWSFSNELARNPGPGQTAYQNAALRLTHRLDPTRMTALDIAGYPSVRLVPLYRKFDAIGTNAYFGWYPGPSGSILNRDVLGPYLDQFHEYYPRQALFVTEFGAEANRGGPIGEKGTFEFQADFMRHHLEVYDSKPYLSGAIAWLLQDFKVRPGWDGYNDKPDPPYNRKGLIDERGNRKPAFDVTARLFRGARAGARVDR